ncbi:MAG: tyrosine--tRNA ligase [Deltaproteobacteria bacterium]|nr:MAG: tyrosine--tRNA ligase [Deltaproteobacteria bacterium]
MPTMDIESQLEIFRRGVVEILPTEDDLVKKLKENRSLRIKLGVDPTASDLHLGHCVPIQKLKQLQDIGHEIYFLIGNFTGQIGDPSEQSKTRPALSEEEVAEHAKTYLDQVFRILNKNKTKVVYNADWFNSMTFKDVVKLAAQTTVARMLERDDFEKRYKSNAPIHLHEFLYPIMQAYDSVVLKADLEIGGTDQRFNMLTARDYQEKHGQEPQVVLLLPILTGTDGTLKMSKTYGNSIGITEPPLEMFSKVMSAPDELMIQWFELLTEVPVKEIRAFEEKLGSGAIHPKDLKKTLAAEITKVFCPEAEAQAARSEWERIHESKEFEAPETVEEIKVPVAKLKDGKVWAVELIDSLGFRDKKGKRISRSEIRRLIRQGGIIVDGTRIESDEADLAVKSGTVISIGKKQFRKLLLDTKK